ncbi:MAG: 2OG-Fe(II) oxygenase [Pseudomonadales bacterium]
MSVNTQDPIALQQRAELGDVAAAIDLAFHYESAGDPDSAVQWMNKAADSGNPHAKMQRAAWILYGENFERDEHKALCEVEEVAHQGNAGNARVFLSVLLAYGIGCDRNWAKAVEWIALEAEGGNEHCLTQLQLLQADAGAQPLQISDIGLAARYAANNDVLNWQVETKKCIAVSPNVEVFPNLAPAAWRKHVIKTARPLLYGAHVKDANTGLRIRDPMRTNTVALIDLWRSDLIFYALCARIANATGSPVNYQEPPNILNYSRGQTYQAHFDFIDPDVEAFKEELEQQGQRSKTPLIYLNDKYVGGETEFPHARCAYKGVAGDLLVLHNTLEDGQPDRNSLHVGTPPSSGEKWVFSTRIRTKPQVAQIWSGAA